MVYKESVRYSFFKQFFLTGIILIVGGSCKGANRDQVYYRAPNRVTIVCNRGYDIWPPGDVALGKQEQKQEVSTMLSPSCTHETLKHLNHSPEVEAYKLYDFKSLEWLSGANMARFMRKSKHARGLMKDDMGLVWIKLKNAPLSSCVYFDQSCNPDDPCSAMFLNLRGSGISKDWLVHKQALLGQRIKMPEVKAFPNGEMVKNVTYSAYLGNIEIKNNKVVKHRYDAVKQESLNFGQLLFALFRGNCPADFLYLYCINIGKAGKKNSKGDVQFDINKEAFQRLINVVEAGESAFAAYLGDHIEKSKAHDFVDLFVVPDVDALKRKILGSVKCKGDQPLGGKPINQDYLVDRLQSAILTVYGPVPGYLTDSLPVYLIPKKNKHFIIKMLADLHWDPDKKQANVTFEQRLCAELATIFPENDSLTEANSGSVLLSNVSSIIEKMADFCIVKKQGGSYLPTPVTKRFLKLFQEFIGHLTKKCNREPSDESVKTYGKMRKRLKKLFL